MLRDFPQPTITLQHLKQVENFHVYEAKTLWLWDNKPELTHTNLTKQFSDYPNNL